MCVNPLYKRVDNVQGFRTIQIPCGKCASCLKRKQNDYMLRIHEELTHCKKAVFFTLTYAPENLPLVVDTSTGESHGIVVKSHIQNWLKRFRESYFRSNGMRCEFRYFVCSEYGPKTFRPHYHGVIIGLDSFECVSLFNDWRSRYGFVKVDDLNLLSPKDILGASKYISKYCSKGVFECKLVKDGILPKCFRLFSKGLGSSYVDRMKSFHLVSDVYYPRDNHFYSQDYLERVISRRKVTPVGSKFSYSMPRYYKSKIYGEKTPLSLQLEKASFMLSQRNISTELEQIQSETNCSFGEASYIHSCNEVRSQVLQNDQCFSSLNSFYLKSQF